MSDVNQKIADLESRLDALEGKADVGGAYRERGGNEISLQDTFRYVEMMGRLVNGMHAAIDKSSMKQADRDDLHRRFADYDSFVMSLHRHPGSL